MRERLIIGIFFITSFITLCICFHNEYDGVPYLRPIITEEVYVPIYSNNGAKFIKVVVEK